jgi:hypothetical protein
MHSLSSTAPFAPTTAPRRCTCNPASRRVFTRSPFWSDDEVAQAESFPTTPTDVLLEVSLGLDRGSLARLLDQPETTSVAPGTPLNPQDRSLHAWFEWVGMWLTLGAVGAAIAAILMG